MRRFGKISSIAVALYLALLAALFAIMRRPAVFGKVMRFVPRPAFLVIPFRPLWFAARAGHLKIGDTAPDFDLASADKKSRVRLSTLRGKNPVVLIFGSYT